MLDTTSGPASVSVQVRLPAKNDHLTFQAAGLARPSLADYIRLRLGVQSRRADCAGSDRRDENALAISEKEKDGKY